MNMTSDYIVYTCYFILHHSLIIYDLPDITKLLVILLKIQKVKT